MTNDAYKFCFWCGLRYDHWRDEACPKCGSRLPTDGFLGPNATVENQRPDYDGPDFTEYLTARDSKG